LNYESRKSFCNFLSFPLISRASANPHLQKAKSYHFNIKFSSKLHGRAYPFSHPDKTESEAQEAIFEANEGFTEMKLTQAVKDDGLENDEKCAEEEKRTNNHNPIGEFFFSFA
jgi:hypothetical protein